MKKYIVTYYDEIEANSIEEAYEKLLVVLESDVKYKDVEAFKFRVGFHVRTKLKKINTYATGRGRVFNLGRGYICFMRG